MGFTAVVALLQGVGGWVDAPSLPRPVTNNAVVAVATVGGTSVFSFLGLSAEKNWDSVVDWAFRWDVGDSAWVEITPVPGPGRLASTAQSIAGRIYLFGGYTIAEDQSEQSLPNVDVYDPTTGRWSSAAPMPVPVDDAVSGVWRDSLIFLVSGWHDSDNVSNVQFFDPARDTWQQATPIPGPPVFGHTGGIALDRIVYVDGVRVDRDEGRFALEASSWVGDINPRDPTQITWTRLPDHPGPALYRGAGGPGHDALAGWVLFLGGSSNPYNYNGVGYDGTPTSPNGQVLGFDVRTGSWREVAVLGSPSMDHRSWVSDGKDVILVGGMGADQRVLDRVQRISERVLLRPVRR